MSDDFLVPAGKYSVRKRFRDEEHKRKKKDMPWSKKILDLNRNQLFGRTAWGWTRILLFYLFLYFLITLILVLWLLVFFFLIIDDKAPRWLKSEPGFSVVPGASIKFFTTIQTELYPIADVIDDFIYKIDQSAEHVFAECNKDKLWGYYSKEPCVFIKVNQVIGFKPDTYDDIDDLSSNDPDDLKETIENNHGEGRIWVTCESSKGEPTTIKFIPGPFFETASGLDGVHRVVALKISHLPHNEYVTFTCKMWAKNIGIDTKFQGKGNVKFDLTMIVKD